MRRARCGCRWHHWHQSDYLVASLTVALMSLMLPMLHAWARWDVVVVPISAAVGNYLGMWWRSVKVQPEKRSDEDA